MYEFNRTLFQAKINQLYDESGETSVEAFAEKVGLSRQTVQFYKTGERSPGADPLCKICTTFNCSADWLLGLSDIQSPDTDVKAICTKTGLSETAVRALTGPFHVLVDAEQISDFIADLRFHDVTQYLKDYRKLKPTWTEKGFATPSPDGNMILPPIDTARFYLNEAIEAFRKLLYENFEQDWKEVLEKERDPSSYYVDE